MLKIGYRQRRVFDNSKYISCLQRDNFRLTDDPIMELQSHAVVTKSGRRYPADVIVSIIHSKILHQRSIGKYTSLKSADGCGLCTT